MKLDILAFAAHPDDIELACSGTLIKHIKLGKKTGIVDLTQGELGTRGSAELRAIEAKKSAEIMGLEYRENLNLGDGYFEINETTYNHISLNHPKHFLDLNTIFDETQQKKKTNTPQ
jgi:LmbE family N-acetylglucosaminyl deacetylase